jgi:YfiH family protein
VEGAVKGLPPHEPVEELDVLGVRAFTTMRAAGTYGTSGTDPVGVVMDRWWTLVEALRPEAPRLATARQVHGTRLVAHGDGWEGWLRADAADGHLARVRGTALAVTIADCVPVFIAHPGGTVGLLHAGWRGTAGGILPAAVAALGRLGLEAGDLCVHLGPAICGSCYEVGPEVYVQLTGRSAGSRSRVDLRAILADQARRSGVRAITISGWCTRCHRDRFFSHRAGDAGRQLAVIVAPMGGV